MGSAGTGWKQWYRSDCTASVCTRAQGAATPRGPQNEACSRAFSPACVTSRTHAVHCKPIARARVRVPRGQLFGGRAVRGRGVPSRRTPEVPNRLPDAAPRVIGTHTDAHPARTATPHEDLTPSRCRCEAGRRRCARTRPFREAPRMFSYEAEFSVLGPTRPRTTCSPRALAPPPPA